jgi:hypothetical protein
MPMDYLRSVEHMQLPLLVVDQHALQCVRVLRAAGMIQATVMASDVSGEDQSALIQAITLEGRVALAKYAQGKAFP